MIRISDQKQGNFFDPWDFQSPKRRKLLDQSWAGLFQKELLCELPVREMAPFFTDGFGRPTKELHTVLGALVLQQTHDLTDEETVDQLASKGHITIKRAILRADEHFTAAVEHSRKPERSEQVLY